MGATARRGAALACVFAGVLVTGAATGSWPEAAGSGEPVPAAGPLPERAEAVDDARELVSRSGDRWAAAYSAEEYQSVELTLAGEYVGTGIAVISAAEGRIVVSEVHAGSPAERAGVLPGDELVTIDGVPVTGRPVTDAVSRLRGSAGSEPAPAGSTVLLGVERDQRVRSVEVERARLTARTVTVTRDEPGVTRIHVSSFVEGSAELVRAAARSAPPDDGIVLDLRGNTGGLLTEAADAAAVFLDGGLVATYDVRGEQNALHAEPGGDTETPLVVLVDGGTMSSAEMLTGALQDRNRAVIVGSPTFGKGTVQLPDVQPDGSVAELTVGRYAAPSGRTVDAEGIVPDLLVGPGEDAEERAGNVLGGLAAGR
ncbi:S41 family peptidase [Streptomyces sp. 8K308]|uniref:S41 family peptidase n=1 Tax=Streptomyces sp. 8K308 TaxID=2530388 RepID=UPI001FB6AA2D|nr:S41 family peptidase [Streptomyces sp. 8K308]